MRRIDEQLDNHVDYQLARIGGSIGDWFKKL